MYNTYIYLYLIYIYIYVCVCVLYTYVHHFVQSVSFYLHEQKLIESDNFNHLREECELEQQCTAWYNTMTEQKAYKNSDHCLNSPEPIRDPFYHMYRYI